MRDILREDRRGVSPVIATILLVAITVVLAAVLYAMVSGIFNPHTTTAEYLGVSLSRSLNGTEWILTFVSVPTGLGQNETSLVLRAGNGSTALPATTLYLLEAASNGVRYFPAAYGPATAGVNDRVVIATASFPSGTQYLFVASGVILTTGTLQ